jgi:hypothetical protein
MRHRALTDRCNPGLDDLFMGLCRRILEGKVKPEDDKAGESSESKRSRAASKAGQQNRTPRKETTIKLEAVTPPDKKSSQERKRKCILF